MVDEGAFLFFTIKEQEVKRQKVREITLKKQKQAHESAKLMEVKFSFKVMERLIEVGA